MFFHHMDLAYTVRVDKPNPLFARLLQQAIGGTHVDAPVPEDATWATSSARDGAAFSLISPEVPAGQEPQLQRVAPYVHAGPRQRATARRRACSGR